MGLCLEASHNLPARRHSILSRRVTLGLATPCDGPRAAVGVQEDTHIGVTLFRDMLPPTARKIVMIAIDVCLAAFGATMLVAGITLMQFGWDTLLPMLRIPESFRTLAITSCGGLVMLFSGTRGLLRILSFGDWNPEAEIKDL